MANPNPRHSQARTAKRRSQFKVRSIPQTHECPNCGGTGVSESPGGLRFGGVRVRCPLCEEAPSDVPPVLAQST